MAESSKFKFCFFELCEIFFFKIFSTRRLLNPPAWNQWIQRANCTATSAFQSQASHSFISPAAVRIKGVGGKKLNFSIICNFRNSLQEITLNFSRDLELYVKMRFQDTLADLNDSRLPKLLFYVTFISLGYSL